MVFPGWLYRITLKSTVWLWWPLPIIANPPKLAMTPAWQYNAMFRTLFLWIAIITASYTNAVVLFTGFVSQIWGEGPPEDLFPTSVLYFLTLDRSGHFRPVLFIMGPTLSVVTLIWLHHTFAKYKIAREYEYEGLQREAERTFPVIERVQRMQSVLLIFYCLLLVGQMAIYFNSQECWTPIVPSVQSWSDWLFGAKSAQWSPKCGGPANPLNFNMVH